MGRLPPDETDSEAWRAQTLAQVARAYFGEQAPGEFGAEFTPEEQRTVLRFARNIGVADVAGAARTARRCRQPGTIHRWPYFCGVCWRRVHSSSR